MALVVTNEDLEENYRRCKANITSLKSDVDLALHSLHQDMALVKDTLLQQSTDMADVKDRIGKQGSIILEMQNDF
jgi:hypothetical protein